MRPVGYDAELRRHNEALRRACGIQFRDHVLDIRSPVGHRHTDDKVLLAGPAPHRR